MTDTHEAVRLADELDKWARDYAIPHYTEDMATKSAALLRRMPEIEANHQTLQDKYDALHIKACEWRDQVAGLEAEVQEQERLNGMGAERELALRAQVLRLEAERDRITAIADEFLDKLDRQAIRFGQVEAERDQLRRIAAGRAFGCQCGDDDVCKIVKERDQLLAELEKVRVPEGWVLVPVEPTPEMVEAACQNGVSVDGRPVWKHSNAFQAEWKYQQMLTAALTPPNADQKGAA